MPPDQDQLGEAAEWLRYAASDLALARVPCEAPIMWETLCFHAQQAAEKALKAVLIARAIEFPKTHSIGALLDLLPGELAAPQDVQNAASLTEYAVLSRYPGRPEPATEEEHHEALRLAGAVVGWAEQACDISGPAAAAAEDHPGPAGT